MSRVIVNDNFAQFLAAVEQSVGDGVMGMAIETQGIAIRKFGKQHGGSPSKPGAYPNSQTGRLRNDINVAKLGPKTAAVGTATEYGRHLEFGANPKAKNVKYLTVPLNRKAALARRRLGTIRSLKLDYRPPAGGKRGGNYGGVLGKTIGKGPRAKFEPWFALYKSVRIAPRPWLRRSWRENRTQVIARGNTEFRKAMARRGWKLG